MNRRTFFQQSTAALIAACGEVKKFMLPFKTAWGPMALRIWMYSTSRPALV